MKPKKFEHIGIMVSDMEASIKFYTEIMGLTLKDRQPRDNGVELVFLTLGDWELELICGTSGYIKGDAQLNHLAFTVENLEAAKEHVKTFVPDMEFTPDMQLWDGLRCTFFRGPSGERLEFFERPE